ncbi:hypothetical protein HYV89_03980 [Candidatus Woesearchaeota archaeon]|nr:hypothetical protein [Candidatus Woesearchaeota archaeon]
MAEFIIKIPDEVKEDLEESNIDWPKLVRKFLTAKLFEIQLSKSIALQRAVFESLTNKSKLSGVDAMELADKINTGMLNELKSEFPEL